MRMKHICVVLTLAGMIGLAVTGAETWLETFENSAGRGALFDVMRTPDDCILAVGATNHIHTPTTQGDVLLIKVALDGTLVWERTWGGDAFEQARAVSPAGEGGAYVFGETASYGGGNRDFFILRISAEGEEVWMKTYGSPQREMPFGMLPLENGDLFIYGETISGREELYGIRIDSDGEIIWEYQLGDSDNQFITGAVEAPNGDLALSIAIGQDGGLVRLDSEGNVLWSQRYESNGWIFPMGALSTEDDGYLLAGFYQGPRSNGRSDVWLARCSSEGVLQWETSFGNLTSNDYAVRLIRLADGSALIGGYGSGLPLWCVDNDGNLLWESHPAPPALHGTFGLLELAEGGFIVSGFRTSGRLDNALILRTNEQGQIAE